MSQARWRRLGRRRPACKPSRARIRGKDCAGCGGGCLSVERRLFGVFGLAQGGAGEEGRDMIAQPDDSGASG